MAGQHATEVDRVGLADQAAGLAELQNAQLPARLEHAMELAQPGLVVGQIPEAECGHNQVQRCGPQRQMQRIGFQGASRRLAGLRALQTSALRGSACRAQSPPPESAARPGAGA